MIALGIDDADLRREMARFGVAAEDGREPLKRFYLAIKPKWILQWNAVKAEGGMFRGAHWPWFANQYTRETDGVTVPAWGGVPRVARGFAKSKKWTETQRRGVSTGERMARTSGNVSGKLRPSGQRVTQASIQMRDTGELQKRLLPPRADITQDRLMLGGDAPDHYEHLRETRPVLFWTQEDQADLNKAAREWLDELANRFNR